MSDSEEDEYRRDFNDIANEIESSKKNPKTSQMFVSGWDDADADINTPKNPEENPVDYVLWAAEHGELEIVKDLVEKQPELVHARDADGYTPMHRAAYSNHIHVISFLLSKGAVTGGKTELGWTPLHSACNWNNYAAAARLLAAGADPASLSEGDQTPLHLTTAISHCKSTLLILLLRENIVKITRKINNSGESPEQLARRHGIYAPLFEMALPAATYIKSIAYTCNPFVRDE